MADLTFDMNPNTTTGLSAEMKTYYSDYLIDNAVPNLVHDQFGQKHPIPANGGKTINFRKFVPFNKANAPLSEGVTPDGGSLSVTNVTAEVSQYGYYVTLSDMLMLTAVDNTLVETTKLLGSQAGTTLDTVTREVLNSGTNVMYAGGKYARAYIGANEKLTVDDIYKAARMLKSQNAPKIDGGYVAIIHPDVAYDLMRDPEWIDVNKYAGAENIYAGEIGKIAGVRFVETTEAKTFHYAPISSTVDTRNVAGFTLNPEDYVPEGVRGEVSAVLTVMIDAPTLKGLIGEEMVLSDPNGEDTDSSVMVIKITGVDTGGGKIFFDVVVGDAGNLSDEWVLSRGGAGAGGRVVYSTLVLGANAYGVTEVSGGGLEHIVKQLGSGGTGDPLNQRATAGWKGTKVAELLVDNYMVRIESASTFESGIN